MQKLFLLLISFILFTLPCFAKKKQEAILIINSKNPMEFIQYDNKIQPQDTFKLGDKIYYMVYTKEGFKSNYIKMQIIKQDDKTNVLGYSRITNKTIRTKNKNYYCDYFTINEVGKYFLQIFDITNLQEWIALGYFRVVNE